MSNADALASKESEPMSEETKQLLLLSLENSLRLGKQMAKKKFTPKNIGTKSDWSGIWLVSKQQINLK